MTKVSIITLNIVQNCFLNLSVLQTYVEQLAARQLAAKELGPVHFGIGKIGIRGLYIAQISIS